MDSSSKQSVGLETGRDAKGFGGGCCKGSDFSYPFPSHPEGHFRLVVLPFWAVSDCGLENYHIDHH